MLYPENSKLYSNSARVPPHRWGCKSVDKKTYEYVIRVIQKRAQVIPVKYLAADLGVSHSTLRNWLGARSPISRHAYRKIEKWLERYGNV